MQPHPLSRHKKAIVTFLTIASLSTATYIPDSLAQSSQDTVTIEEALRICNRIRNTRDRLDCFEGLADAAAPEEATSARNAEPTSSPELEESPQNAEVAEDNPRFAAPVVAPPAPADPNSDASASSKRFVILEEEDAKERLDVPRTPREKGENYTTTVRKTWFNAERKLMILMANGEIWKQNQSESVRKPKVGTEVSLKRTSFGSWFLKVPPNHRSVRMRIINP